VSGLTILGNGNTGTGIDLRNASDSTVSRVKILAANIGVVADYGWCNEFHFVHCVLCRNSGFVFGYQSNATLLVECASYLNANYGLESTESRKLTCLGCTFEVNTAGGVYISSSATTTAVADSVTIRDSYIEGNGDFEILVQAGGGGGVPTGVVIEGNYFVCLAAKASVGVRVVNVNGCSIENNTFVVGSAAYANSIAIGGSSISGVRTKGNADASTGGITATSYYTSVERLASKANGRFNVAGGAISSFTGFGVQSVTRVSAGVYEITMLPGALPTDSYSIVASAENGSSYSAMLCSPTGAVSATVFRINTAAPGGALAEARNVWFAVYE
jgi:hypothetical protein